MCLAVQKLKEKVIYRASGARVPMPTLCVQLVDDGRWERSRHTA